MRRIHIVDILQLGGDHLDLALGGEYHILAPLGGRREDLGTGGHRHRPRAGARLELHQAGRGGGAGGLDPQQVQKFRIILPRQLVKAVDGLGEQLPKQGDDGCARVVGVPRLIAPLGGICLASSAAVPSAILLYGDPKPVGSFLSPLVR